MADERLCWLPATELAALMRRKKVSPVEVMDAILDRIERINPKLNAFVTLTDEAARREAKAAERALTRRRTVLRPLHGVQDRKSTRLNSSHSQISYAVL